MTTQAPDRFRLNRAGILNVWQYDSQEFSFAEGRLLLRGANGAGKSKTLEMLLPFALDGDKSRLTASAKHHTSLLWLMTDGYDGSGRIGYVWVEFLRTQPDGKEEAFTCGVGIRASASQRSATAWHFTTNRRIGIDLALDPDGTPMSRAQLAEELGPEGHVFERATAYKEHVGRALFGLDSAQYDDVLRLLYWLRQPQIGEDIEPEKLTGQLSQALPQLDEQALRTAGDTFDELVSFGEQIERRAAAAAVLDDLAQVYAAYAQATVAERARAVQAALRTERRLRTASRKARTTVGELSDRQAGAIARQEAELAAKGEDEARLRTLESRPELRDQRRLSQLADNAARDEKLAGEAVARRARAEAQVTRLTTAVDDHTRQVRGNLAEHTEHARSLHGEIRQLAPEAAGILVPRMLEDPVALGPVHPRGTQTQGGDEPAASAASVVVNFHDALDRVLTALQQARAAMGVRLAAVAVVRESLEHAEEAARNQRQAEQVAADAELRWEVSRALAGEAEQTAESELSMFDDAIRSWIVACPQADAPEEPAPSPLRIEIELIDEWDADAVATLPEVAADSSRLALESLREGRARANAQQHEATSRIEHLRSQRAEVAAEHDPAPPAPALPRTARPDGLALWQVVDFAEGLDDSAKAGVEAALQAAGLLDAWIRPGGQLLDREQRDVVLHAAVQTHTEAESTEPHATTSGTLAQLLVVDLPDGCDVSRDDVHAVLGAIGVGGDEAGDVDEDGSDATSSTVAGASNHTAWVRPDGTWRLGPAYGRAAKQSAQFIGAVARAQERLRRLAEIDDALAEQQRHLDEAVQLADSLARQITAIEGWLRAVPSGRNLLDAWMKATERRSVEARDGEANRVAQNAARAARTAAAEALTQLQHLAAEHALPAETQALAAAEQALRSLARDLDDAARNDPPIRLGLRTWAEALASWAEATENLEVEQAATAEAEQQAKESKAEFDTLRATVGATIQQLEQEISGIKRSLHAHQKQASAAESEANALREQLGEARAEARNTDEQLAGHLQQRTALIASLAATAEVPGLLAAAGAGEEDADELRRLASHPAGDALAPAASQLIDTLAGLSEADVVTAKNRIHKAHTEATSGPAADHQPTVLYYDELWAVSGRDDAGEAPVVELAMRVSAAVARDRDLLTEREKKQFEQHVLGELGDAVRRCRRDADELVAAMNEQLAGITTSQGIRVKLDWKLRDDVPSEAREAVRLLSGPVDALIPSERARLRDVLHQLIEASRAERPDLSYTEHLGAALDYRIWSAFTIRYTRPETEGHWERLHRRSALSQGEQKVLCYLPLFAAAAAHFTSLAGAAPHAPRLVLLDDAFPKIDVRTHPLLFGLLVQLDLDFIITSERLWGDHDSVPALAIYEALRDPAQRGIAQYEYRWDGRELESVG